MGETRQHQALRLTIRSSYEMLDFVQLVCDRLATMAGLDEDSLHWLGVAVRETVINAIKHGNKQDAHKTVSVEFTFVPNSTPTQFVITVTDQGEGFEPSQLADPLAPENILKASGRGIFFMRSFMDEVNLRRMPGGGMEVRLVKNLAGPPSALAN